MLLNKTRNDDNIAVYRCIGYKKLNSVPPCAVFEIAPFGLVRPHPLLPEVQALNINYLIHAPIEILNKKIIH